MTSKLPTTVFKPAGVYDHEALKPPGITNSALNCYANAILQCLMSSKSFLGLINSTISSHSASCEECKQPGVRCNKIREPNIIIMSIEQVNFALQACWSTFKSTMFMGVLQLSAAQ